MIPQKEARGDASWTAAWVFFVGVLAAYGFIVMSARLPPALVDYPDWVYQGVLLHGVLTGHPFAGYVFKHYPVPNSTTTLGLGLLDGLLPWQWAGKLWIVFYLALAAFASWRLLHALAIREWRLVVALPAIVFLNLNFWYGNISFEIGLCLVLLMLAELVRGAPTAWVSALLVLIFFTHMEACASALLLLLLWCGASQRWTRLWAATPALILTLWYAAARFGSGNADVRGLPHADYTYGSPVFLAFKANTFLKTFGYINASTASGLSQSEQMLGKGVFVLVILVSLTLALLCLAVILRAVLQRESAAPKDGASTEAAARPTVNWRPVLGGFVWMLMALSLLLPQVFLGVADPGSRLLLLGSAMGLLMVRWRGAAGTAIALLSALLVLVNLWQFAQVQRNPTMAGSPPDLPASLLRYGHVEPSTRVDYYDDLQRGQMNQPVFPTGMFVDVPQPVR